MRRAIVSAVPVVSACAAARPQASRDADLRALSSLPEVLITSPGSGPGVMASDIDIGAGRIWLAVPTAGLSVTLPFFLSDQFERGARLTATYQLDRPTTAVASALMTAVARDTTTKVRWRLVPESDAPESRESPPTVRVGPGLVWLRHVPFRGRLYRVTYAGGAVVRTGENVAHGSKMFPPFAWFGRCYVSVGTAADGLTREKLLANGAALLEQKIEEAQRTCGEQLGGQLALALRSRGDPLRRGR